MGGEAEPQSPLAPLLQSGEFTQFATLLHRLAEYSRLGFSPERRLFIEALNSLPQRGELV